MDCAISFQKKPPIMPHTLTLFKTKIADKIADFPTLFKTEFPFLIPCLRRLTRNHTLCSLVRRPYAQDVFRPRKDILIKTKIDKIDILIKTKKWLNGYPV